MPKLSSSYGLSRAWDGGSDRTPLLDFLGVGGVKGNALQCPEWGDFPCDECRFGPIPPSVARAIGYQVLHMQISSPIQHITQLCLLAGQMLDSPASSVGKCRV